MPADYDSPWKEVMDKYFESFVEMLFPNVYASVAWSKGFESLDGELQKVVRDAQIGRRLADKLVKVHDANENELFILVHTEVQGEFDADFAKRMFTYHYRIMDRYDRPVVSLAVLGDDRLDWRPSGYVNDRWGCRLDFTFPTVKVKDFEKDWSSLECSSNPFATVIMAHLKSRETRENDEDRKFWKFDLLRRMYERGFERQRILDLYRFIDWVMVLPEEIEQRFEEELEAYEKERKMPYVTSIERRGVERGMQKGMEQGRADAEQKMLLRILKKRFGSVSGKIEARIRGAGADQLEKWIDRALDAGDVGEVF